MGTSRGHGNSLVRYLVEREVPHAEPAHDLLGLALRLLLLLVRGVCEPEDPSHHVERDEPDGSGSEASEQELPLADVVLVVGGEQEPAHAAAQARLPC